VTNIDCSLRSAKIGADIIQMDKIKPDEAKSIIEQVKKINQNAIVSLAGGINLQNVHEYAKTGADILVTSSLYHARPLDITTKIVKSA
jgi:molybdenum transport protein